VKRVLLNKLFYKLIFFLIVVEVLRFLVHPCVVSFSSQFQYGLLLLLTPHSSDPNISTILVATNNTAIIIGVIVLWVRHRHCLLPLLSW
jgi:hypothetical protein